MASENNLSTTNRAQSYHRSTRSSHPPLIPPLITNPKKKKRALSSTSSVDTSTLPNTESSPKRRAVVLTKSTETDTSPATGRRRRLIAEETDEEDEEESLTQPEQASFQDSDPRSSKGTYSNDDIFSQLDDADQLGTRSDGTASDVESVASTRGAPASVHSDQGEPDNDLILPEMIEITVNFRKGQPPAMPVQGNPNAETPRNLRQIKDWPAVSFIYTRGERYNTFLGHVTDQIDILKEKKPQYLGLQWWDSATPYIQPTRSTRQGKFSPLTREDFERKIDRAYRTEASWKKSLNETTKVVVNIFVYLKDTASNEGKTLKRQSRVDIEDANRRLNEARAAGNLNIGQLTQTIYSRELASATQDITQPIPPPPDNPLYRQAQSLDDQLDGIRRRAATGRQSRDIVPVKFLYPDDQWVTMKMDLTEIRRALGFDLTRIGERTRDPEPPVVTRPATDVPDIDHL